MPRKHSVEESDSDDVFVEAQAYLTPDPHIEPQRGAGDRSPETPSQYHASSQRSQQASAGSVQGARSTFTVPRPPSAHPDYIPYRPTPSSSIPRPVSPGFDGLERDERPGRLNTLRTDGQPPGSRASSRDISFPIQQDDEECEACDRTRRDISYCNVCDINLCADCWPKQPQHKKQRLGLGKVRHEKTNVADALKIQKVLSPPANPEKLNKLHEADEQTAWFGIDRPDGYPPVFQDYGRYAELLTESQEAWFSTFRTSQPGRDGRTPSLVSFVGQTGAGKSTLIKLLIDLATTQDQEFRTPVVGASGANVPTSEDVHLYSDPMTALTDAPTFFADCEGLQGGEREPLGAKFKRNRKKAANVEPAPLPVSERELQWASNSNLSGREYAVTNLYPRLLYTFSDVIVFVLRNPRIVESVLEQLVNWAAAALETSSNQPVLPHAIIALNASENDINEQEWDPDVATSTILESISRTVFKNPAFKKYAEFWRVRKKEIESVEQLMLSYYSSIRVVRIPREGRPRLIKDQITKLYGEVSKSCTLARDRKAELRMLLDAEELQSYLQCAFDHFAISLDRPFDFVQASFSNSPIPLDFGGNILKLAINLMNVWENIADIRFLFQELSYMVASCIMLDSARQKIRGGAQEIFPQYLPHIDAAHENFCEKHWPCEYVQSSGRCVNVKSGHGSKGHQLKDGTVIAVGDYQAKWDFEELQEEFRINCYFRLEELLGLLKERMNPGEEEMRVAAVIHRDDVMAWFYRHVSRDGKSERYNSHSVCFCCLSEPPQHPLPCGHVLCTSCIKTYGEQRSKTEIEIQGCPLEVQTTQTFHSWKIYAKPKAAGVRILTLDGGGIRGIVELEILQALEHELGGNLAIQSFFDLIVGTSTGGLVALGLVARNWSVRDCILQFEELCEKAFTRRKGGNIPGISWLVDNYNRSKFETGPLQEALRSAFSEDQYLFGGRRFAQYWTSSIKVAVTATLSSNSAVLLTNYNRRCDEKLPYQFQRAEGIETELKTWEAARATSAAPRVFKPFHHEPSKHIYMDGAIYHNNPVQIADREWKLLWGTEPCEYPDFMLSLGTAYNPHSHRKPVKRAPSFILKRGLLNQGKTLIKIAKDHIDNTLDCERTWQSYVTSLPAHITTSRFDRVNISLMRDPPALDDVHSMKSLQEEVKKQLSGSYANRLRGIAMRLLATSFYFETERVQQFMNNAATATGRIYCRFTEGSRDVKELGKFMKNNAFADRNPYFYIRERGVHGKTEKRDIGPDVIGKMIFSGKFEMRNLHIQMANKLSESEIWLYLNENHSYQISGFPRCLFQDEKDTTKTLHPLAVNTRRWAGRSDSQQMRRNLWKPPEKASVSRQRTISDYSNANHQLGHATADELRSSADYFSGGIEGKTELDAPPGIAELDPAAAVGRRRAAELPG